MTKTTRANISPHSTARATYAIRATVWLYDGIGGWHFVTLPSKISAVIRAVHGSKAKPFGSIRVSVKIGGTEWKTSLFPDKKSGSYLFALKSEVRKREGIAAGDMIRAEVRVE
jgi:hypothetical protein